MVHGGRLGWSISQPMAGAVVGCDGLCRGPGGQIVSPLNTQILRMETEVVGKGSG